VRRVEVRLIHAGEFEAAGRLVVAAYEALEGSHMTGEYATELADVARRAQEADVFVAAEGSELQGCVTFVPDASNPWAEGLVDGEASIRMLAVDPEAQGKGAGRALLDACVHQAHALGRSAVFLHSTPWMTAAHHLYDRAGFIRVRDRDWLPIPEVPLLAFRLDLAETRPPPERGSPLR
jgi:ribosomal protein S18 acetylase RimI-like enzyme